MAMRNPYNYSKPQNPVAPPAQLAKKAQVAPAMAYQQNKTGDYLAQKVMSARPEELTLMLYEGLVKFVKQAQLYIDNKDIENTHRVLLRAQAIVEELDETLDMAYEVSRGLRSLYLYIEDKLIDANLKKNRKYLDEALPICEELKETWKEAMKSMR